MARYRYLFADLRTNRINAELPLADVSYSDPLSASGSLSAVLDLGDRRVTALDPIGATTPGRSAMYVERDNSLVWGGIVWTRSYDSASGQLRLGAAQFSSYFDGHAFFVGSSGGPYHRVYTDTPAETICADMIGYAMSGYASGIGIASAFSGTPSGQLRTRTYLGSELRSFAEILSELAGDDPGFEWGNEVSYDTAGSPAKVLRFSFPRRGRSAPATRLVWEYPGNVASYAWPEDGAAVTNAEWGLGTGPANQPLATASVGWDRLTEGWPLLAAVYRGKAFRDVGALTRATAADQRARSLPLVSATLTLRPDAQPNLGDWITGDRARLYIDDPRRFPVPLEATVRVIETKVAVARSGAETVTVTVDQDVT